ncbi:hypothetical protein BYT27DRAFT_7195445 [Phlegmacium glaucopus]|nr:hypothetical protein BYT27DRAFT_7195445 [Phlegmacium glaucopus]
MLKSLVDEWLRLDPNPETRNEIQRLWDNADNLELERRLRTRIEFGTAGLRGRMEAGWSRINDLIIIQTSQGLAEYVSVHVCEARNRGLVVGHDHRHHSEHWARLAAQVFITKGFRVYLLQGNVHTPLIPFSVNHLRAACGVMITASHNPKYDNGYKVYWENAVQIIAPHDEGISKTIQLNLQPKEYSAVNLSESILCVDFTQEMRKSYFQSLAKNNLTRELNQQSTIKFVNTSMHGVSDSFVMQAFRIFGFRPYIPVNEQQFPDPEFPTVRFPNPEEKGALDLALRTAEREGADYVLAQDPDADRFIAAERGPTGNWTIFTGDQLGSLFADKILQSCKSSGAQPVEKLAMVASTVSSKMLETMAKAEGFRFVECLTGFKFIGNTALVLVEEGYEVPFGYEEAIGFMFGPDIRDKDGIAATMLFAELAVSLRAMGKSVNEHLQELYSRYGHFETNNSYFICNDPKITDDIFSRIRNYGSFANSNRIYPKSLAGLEITRVIDLTVGYDSGNPPNWQPALPISSGHMIQLRAGSKDVTLVLTLRTSGTEPKIKYYLEGSGGDPQAVKSFLHKATLDIAENWIQVDKHNLATP